ncbi:hypothetical protein, partial [Sorangium cellulosum]|uniref:hypothetical protein n=1 Tax=Sorangium cellulosum TaxID=56 RepID=UPI000B30965E
MVASRAAGPAVAPLPCSGCSKLIDPLRAGHVAIFDQRFHYFCNARCRHAFLGEVTPAPGDGRPAPLAGSGVPIPGAPARGLPPGALPGAAGPHA